MMNAPLHLKNLMQGTSCKYFGAFDKHMKKIGHLECTNLKGGNFCL